MQVKDVHLAKNIQVIDPSTGQIWYFNGLYNNGIFVTKTKFKSEPVYPIEIPLDEFLDWKVINEKKI